MAYFGDYSALRPEAYAVAVFAVLGLLGLRFPALLVLGYALHGGWDLAHEVWVHLGAGAGGARSCADIPPAYGMFCAAYDWCMAGYFFTRRAAWRQQARHGSQSRRPASRSWSVGVSATRTGVEVTILR